MEKYIKPEIAVLTTERIMEDDAIVVSDNSTIDDSIEILAKPYYYDPDTDFNGEQSFNPKLPSLSDWTPWEDFSF